MCGRRGRSGRAIGPVWAPAVMMPDGRSFARQLHVDWLSLPPVGAEVARAVLQLLHLLDVVGAAGRGHGPHAKRQGHLHTRAQTRVNTDIKYVHAPIKQEQVFLVQTASEERQAGESAGSLAVLRGAPGLV